MTADAHETEFTACLLALGPPEHLSRMSIHGEVGSLMEFRMACEDWWREYTDDRSGVPAWNGPFGHWYACYKQWLMENGYGTD